LNQSHDGIQIDLHGNCPVTLGNWGRLVHAGHQLGAQDGFAGVHASARVLVLHLFQATSHTFLYLSLGPLLDLNILGIELGSDVDVDRCHQDRLGFNASIGGLLFQHLADANRSHQAATQRDDDQDKRFGTHL
jgi:hypothetical protein